MCSSGGESDVVGLPVMKRTLLFATLVANAALAAGPTPNRFAPKEWSSETVYVALAQCVEALEKTDAAKGKPGEFAIITCGCMTDAVRSGEDPKKAGEIRALCLAEANLRTAKH